MLWVKLVLWAVVLFALLWGAALIVGGWRWAGQVARLKRRMLAAAPDGAVRWVDDRSMEALPPPVARYLRKVLPEQGALPRRVEMAHEGRFNLSTGVPKWRRFTSTQLVTLGRLGFVWDGRVAMAPGLPVRVIDAYVAGEGVLWPAILGLVPLLRLQGAGAIAEGELLRWLAEAPWYPGVLLPGNGVEWRAVDDRSAEARLVDGAVKVRLLFRFGADDLVCSVRAEARGRMVGGQMVPTPWEGRWWAYEQRGGVLVPTRGEVAWHLPEGARPYWRGRLAAYRPLPAP